MMKNWFPNKYISSNKPNKAKKNSKFSHGYNKYFVDNIMQLLGEEKQQMCDDINNKGLIRLDIFISINSNLHIFHYS